jgi:hypothetical protein
MSAHQGVRGRCVDGRLNAHQVSLHIFVHRLQHFFKQSIEGLLAAAE